LELVRHVVLEYVGALLPVGLGPWRARARPATAAAHIGAVLMVLSQVPKLLLAEPL
jgi:hypothetical protein